MHVVCIDQLILSLRFYDEIYATRTCRINEQGLRLKHWFTWRENYSISCCQVSLLQFLALRVYIER